MAEKASARSISPNISVDRRTGCAAARRLMRESSESALCGLITRSMRCISAITASIAAWPAASSSAHSSTVMAVPMMASSRLNQPACVTTARCACRTRAALREANVATACTSVHPGRHYGQPNKHVANPPSGPTQPEPRSSGRIFSDLCARTAWNCVQTGWQLHAVAEQFVTVGIAPDGRRRMCMQTQVACASGDDFCRPRRIGQRPARAQVVRLSAAAAPVRIAPRSSPSWR